MVRSSSKICSRVGRKWSLVMVGDLDFIIPGSLCHAANCSDVVVLQNSSVSIMNLPITAFASSMCSSSLWSNFGDWVFFTVFEADLAERPNMVADVDSPARVLEHGYLCALFLIHNEVQSEYLYVRVPVPMMFCYRRKNSCDWSSFTSINLPISL